MNQVVYRLIPELTPYARNARTHSKEQVAQIAASIKEWGWTIPILINGDNTIIAGHGRVMAARQLGMKEVPCIVAEGWTDAQMRAYVLADNKLAENAGWDDEILKAEIEELTGLGFNIDLTGFSEEELEKLFKTDIEALKSLQVIETPIYSPKGDQPDIKELTDTTKSAALIAAIKASNVSKAEKDFLIHAAARHTIFDYQAIAEYYCHASPEMQRLMEDSALVIIDFAKAIEDGYVELTRRLDKLFLTTHGDDEDDDE